MPTKPAPSPSADVSVDKRGLRLKWGAIVTVTAGAVMSFAGYVWAQTASVQSRIYTVETQQTLNTSRIGFLESEMLIQRREMYDQRQDQRYFMRQNGITPLTPAPTPPPTTIAGTP